MSPVGSLGPGWDTSADDWIYADNGTPPKGWARGCSVGYSATNTYGNHVTVAAVTMILRRRTDPDELRRFMEYGSPRGPGPDDLHRVTAVPGIGDAANGVTNTPIGDVERPYVLWTHRGANSVQLTVEIYHEPSQPSGPKINSTDAQRVLTQIAGRLLDS
ncbi:hypothetical protein [Frankia sp. Cr2]|uniref:hypothetical protein n=1 Tax=Frankia sp. Cr2 TaxID=3073932 RepID=UPI002AD2AE00|nr:hypothetical protein [Frankia sp. Cr2]